MTLAKRDTRCEENVEKNQHHTTAEHRVNSLVSSHCDDHHFYDDWHSKTHAWRCFKYLSSSHLQNLKTRIMIRMRITNILYESTRARTTNPSNPQKDSRIQESTRTTNRRIPTLLLQESNPTFVPFTCARPDAGMGFQLM